jgi:release factor glutamine methyltransferase
MPETAVTLGLVLDDAAECLRRANLAEPRREALRIWNDLTRSSAAESLLGRDLEVEPSAVARYQRSIRRRSAGEPAPHVSGWVGFRHLTLQSDARALIPRPETEGLVDLLLDRVRYGRVADIGTGSGCIALSLALEANFEQVLAIDCSSEALALAHLNRQQLELGVELLRGDLCSPLRPQSIDALISNPPYLTVGEFADLDASVRDWEPALALVGGESGLETTERLLDQGRSVLRAGGWLAIEVDCSRAGSAAHRALELGWEDVAVHADLFGRERYVLARRSNTS